MRDRRKGRDSGREIKERKKKKKESKTEENTKLIFFFLTNKQEQQKTAVIFRQFKKTTKLKQITTGRWGHRKEKKSI